MTDAPLEYSTFFRQEFAPVLRTVELMLRDHGRAEELTQDAFVQLLQHWVKVSQYERPDAWVRRVAIRLAVRSLRRDRLWQLARGGLLPRDPDRPSELDVGGAIRRLPGSQRAAIVLHYYEDRPTAEVAAQGIDLAAYDLAANAADLDDLRTALGISQWNLMTNGDASRLAFEVARRYPAGLRSLTIDSPSLPSPDFLAIGPTALDAAIARLVALCALEAGCAGAYPALDAEIRSAIDRLDAHPKTLEVTGTIDAIRLDHPIQVVIDGAALVRIIRWGLGSRGGSNAVQSLQTVRAAVQGSLSAKDPGVVALASDAGNCLGLLTSCERPNLGALYSIFCRDFATPDPTRLQGSLDGRAAYADVFAPSPLLAPCQTWGVQAATPFAGGGLTGGVPTLVLRGDFDPFSAPTADVVRAAGGAPNVYTVDVPNQSYNVLGYNECPRAIRNAWIDAVTAPPADVSCLQSIPRLDLSQ